MPQRSAGPRQVDALLHLRPIEVQSASLEHDLVHSLG